MRIFGKAITLEPMPVAVGLIVLCIALLIASAFAKAKLEREHPCLAYGPERIEYYQKIGDMMYPVYEKPCVQRADSPMGTK